MSLLRVISLAALLTVASGEQCADKSSVSSDLVFAVQNDKSLTLVEYFAVCRSRRVHRGLL